MQVVILPLNRILEAREHERLSELLARADIPVSMDCAGKGRCGKCKVLMTKGNDKNPTPEERRLLSGEELAKGIRLACCVRLFEDSCIILSDGREDAKEELGAGRPHSVTGPAGVVFDMGTTTLEMAVFDRSTGEKYWETARPNPQKKYGADIISRLEFCLRSAENEAAMQDLLAEAFDDMLFMGRRELSLPADRIDLTVAAGNAVMSHFFARMPVKGLERAPFFSGFRGDLNQPAGRLKLSSLAAGCPVLLPAHLGGYVGSDALLGALASGMLTREGSRLLVDIGTNAEMVLKCPKGLLTCSVPAGPAFEGAAVYQGMRGEAGAVYSAEEADGRISCRVIGDGYARGICGSGLIDCMAVLRRLHMMDETGYLTKRDPAAAPGITIAENPDRTRVRLLQEDIRKLQVAKAAVFAGASLLLEEAGQSAGSLDGLYLAGNFGSHIRMENAFAIGLLPLVPKERIYELGNGVIGGGKMLLCGSKQEELISRMARMARHLELAGSERFRLLFIEAMNFPEQECIR